MRKLRRRLQMPLKILMTEPARNLRKSIENARLMSCAHSMNMMEKHILLPARLKA